MIIGIGNDIADMERIKRIMDGNSGPRFIERILTTAEREAARHKKTSSFYDYTAGRFAAKEAVVKALGCGIGKQVGFLDIEIVANDQGKPECHLSAAAMQRLSLDKSVFIHISISHSVLSAAAFAVIEQR